MSPSTAQPFTPMRKRTQAKKSELTGNANWGAKFDTFGNKVKWFGYKLHLAVDAKSELPMALQVTPAHVNDGDEGPALMTTVAAKSNVKFFMLDAGYDQMKKTTRRPGTSRRKPLFR
ncbi:transposase [Paenibacillus rhizoplanae]